MKKGKQIDTKNKACSTSQIKLLDLLRHIEVYIANHESNWLYSQWFSISADEINLETGYEACLHFTRAFAYDTSII